jgi:hypothetical protein
VSLDYSADDLVEDLIGDATRLALAATDPDDPVTSALDVLRLLALCDLRLVADPRGFTRRAIRRVETAGPS